MKILISVVLFVVFVGGVLVLNDVLTKQADQAIMHMTFGDK